MPYPELKLRVTEIRRRLAAARATLVAGEGLERAITRADAIADNNGPAPGAPQHEFLENARACTAMWDLSETLRLCDSRGLDMSTHLRNITTGTVDYGIPAAPRTHSHYFKDFQLELFVAAQCITARVPHVALNAVSNAPDGDLVLETLRCEVKHPNSLGQLSRNLKDFNNEIRDRNLYGVFVTGIEDMFNVFPRMFPDDASFQVWLTSKRRESEFFARSFYRMAADREHILATVQVWTFWYQVQGAVSLWRESNSVVFDHRIGIPAQQYEDANRIACVFNPQIRRWTQIEQAVNSLMTNDEREQLRAALHKKAYAIWQDDGEPVGRALDNWVEAKSEFNLPPDLMI
jgi:hypothetical protein